MVVVGAQFLVLPPAGYGLAMEKSNLSTEANDLAVAEMIKTKSFYFIWLMFLFGCVSGLLVIGLAKDIGVQLAGLKPDVAANAVAMIALFNAGGRLIWGTLSDKLGRIKVVLLMFVITSVCMLAMSIISLSFVTFFACLSGIAFCFGGFLAVFPTITGDFYGIKNLGANYGIVYQAYGLAALVGPVIVAYAGGLKPTFIIAAILSIVGALMTFWVK